MDFIANRKIWFTFSLTLIAIGIVVMVFNGFVRGSVMNFGIDFTGGTMLTVRFQPEAQIGLRIQELRNVLQEFKLAKSVIQKTGDNDLTIKTEPMDNELRKAILEKVDQKFGKTELLEADIVGPVIGSQLRTQAIWALLLATLGMILYVSARFEFKYALAATLALYHDALITVGIMALLWRNIETPFIAAILTILGYSINDTIVIFDRIRENYSKAVKGKKDFKEIVNTSIWQTMARSINTILTVLVMDVALLVFAGAMLSDFAFTLLIGFIFGGYSSIFIASPLVVIWSKGARVR